jgi:hypothetical protein
MAEIPKTAIIKMARNTKIEDMPDIFTNKPLPFTFDRSPIYFSLEKQSLF